MRRFLFDELHNIAVNIENLYFNMSLTKKNIPLFIGQYEKSWKKIEAIKVAMDEDLKLIKEGKDPKNIIQ